MAELKKHPRHLHFEVYESILYSVYSTIRGERVLEVGYVDGYQDTERLSDDQIKEVEKIVV